jgi:hypothetical protein
VIALDLEPEGLGYRAFYTPEAIGLHIDRLVESRGDLSGELTVARAPEGHILRARFNLVSMTTRSSMAKTLQGIAPMRKEGPGWLALLEAFCVGVLDAERDGTETVMLGTKPARGAPAYLMEPFLLAGNVQTILYADGGTGKSTLAAAVAVAVASGTSMFNGSWMVEKPRPVLVLDWETDADNWNDMIVSVAKGFGIEPPQVGYMMCDRPLPNIIHEVAKTVTSTETALVIIDSTGHAMPGQREGTSAEDGAMRLTKAIRMLGTAALLIDHVPKGQEDGRLGPYGSRYKWNNARAAFELRAASEDDGTSAHHLALLHRKHNLTPRERPMGFRVERADGAVTFTREDIYEDESLLATMSLSQRVQRVLLQNAPMTIREIADQLGTGPKTVGVTLNRNKDRFVKVRQEGREQYWAVKSNNSNIVVQHVGDSAGTPSDVRPSGTHGDNSNMLYNNSNTARSTGGEGGKGGVVGHSHLQHDDPSDRVGDSGPGRGAGEGPDDDDDYRSSFEALMEANELRRDASMRQ